MSGSVGHPHRCMQIYAFLVVNIAAADKYIFDHIVDGTKLIAITVKPVRNTCRRRCSYDGESDNGQLRGSL